MKKTLLVLAACSMVSASYAQTYTQFLSFIKARQSQHVSAILAGQQQNTAAKTTGTKQRVIAQSIYNLDNNMTGLELTDSSRYKYSGIRGSKFGFEYMQYDDYMNSADVNYDTLTRWDNANGTALTYTDRSIGKFNAAGKRDTLIQQVPGTNPSVLVNDLRYRYTYNSSGNVSVMYEDNWTGSIWATSYKTVYLYNAANKVLADTIYAVNGSALTPSERDFNTYDASNNLTLSTHQYFSSNTWYNTARYTYSYYTNNKLKLTITESANPSHVLRNYAKDSLGYTTNIDFHTYDKYDLWDSTANSWVNYIIEKKHLNTSNLPDSMNTLVSFMGISFTDKLVFAYNSFGNPTLATDYNSAFGIPGSGIAGKSFYYYETYNDPTGIAITPKYQSVVLYPNPAAEELSIRREEYTANDIAIVWNAAGQKLLQQSAHNTNTTISIASLAPGMYWLSVENESGIVARKSFIKK